MSWNPAPRILHNIHFPWFRLRKTTGPLTVRCSAHAKTHGSAAPMLLKRIKRAVKDRRRNGQVRDHVLIIAAWFTSARY